MRATQETKPEAGKVYSLNFSTGKLEPITAAGLLPVGAVVTYEDRANPKKRFVVTAAAFDAYGNGQRCICEDGHTTTVSRSAINGPGGWHDTGEVLNAEEIAAFRAGAPATVAPVAVQVGGSADISVSHNAAKNGIEIRFATKPAADVLADLKSRGWRWSRFSGCWYATATQASADYAAQIANMADDERRTLLAKLQNNTPDHFDIQVEDNMRAACGC
jgi:hypothetical protein